MYRVDDVTRCAWWPYSSSGDAIRPPVDGLWLPVSPDGAGGLLDKVAGRWSSWAWLLMGTWYRKRGESDPRGFDARYPGLAREIVGRVQAESPRGLVSDTEWCVADPRSHHLFDFFEMLRRSRGKGGAAVLTDSAASVRSWYALSGGMFWRASLAMELEGEQGSEESHRSLITMHVRNMSERGYVSLVPLDLHPEAGFAAFAQPQMMDVFAEATLISVSDVPLLGVRGVLGRGGGLAL
ncbi:hypothetical protein SUDANB132_04450 [Streptomyces sp. enrichment culture]